MKSGYIPIKGSSSDSRLDAKWSKKKDKVRTDDDEMSHSCVTSLLTFCFIIIFLALVWTSISLCYFSFVEPTPPGGRISDQPITLISDKAKKMEAENEKFYAKLEDLSVILLKKMKSEHMTEVSYDGMNTSGNSLALEVKRKLFITYKLRILKHLWDELIGMEKLYVELKKKLKKYVRNMEKAKTKLQETNPRYEHAMFNCQDIDLDLHHVNGINLKFRDAKAIFTNQLEMLSRATVSRFWQAFKMKMRSVDYRDDELTNYVKKLVRIEDEAEKFEVESKDFKIESENIAIETEDIKIKIEDIEIKTEDIIVKPEDTIVKPEDTIVKPEDTIVKPEDIM